MRHGQQSALDATIFEASDESRHRVERSGDDRVRRPIQRRDRNVRPTALLDLGRHRGFIRENGGHDAVPRQRLHETRAFHDQPERLLERIHAGAISGRELADAVPKDDVGNDPPGAPQRDEAGLHREQRRLSVGGLIDQARIRVPAQEHVPERLLQTLARDLGAAVDFLAEDGLMAIELRAHSRVLRRLPGEQKGEPAISDRSRRGAVAGCRRECVSQLFFRTHDGRKPRGKMRSAACAGQAKVAQRRLIAREPREVASDRSMQRGDRSLPRA